MVTCVDHRLWLISVDARWRCHWLNSLPGMVHPYPLGHDGSWWSRNDLVRNPAISSSCAAGSYATREFLNGLRAGATRSLALKISHVIMNPPRATLGRIYFIEVAWHSEKHPFPTRLFIILHHRSLKSPARIMRWGVRSEKRGVSRSSIALKTRIS